MPKVILDPISKVKIFEPFNILIPIESWEDLNNMLRETAHLNALTNPVSAEMHDRLVREKHRQQNL